MSKHLQEPSTKSKYGIYGKLEYYQDYGKLGSIYRRVSGEEILVTCVTKEKDSGLQWDDVVYLGEVEGFVREAK